MRRLYFLIFILLLILPVTFAATPFQVSTATGMQVEYPKHDVIKQRTDYRFHAHVINETSIKTNKTTTCLLHVYNQSGYDLNLSSQWMEWEDYNGVDFAKTVYAGNFSSIGTYSYVIQCNSSNQVAFASGQLEVTPSGKLPNQAEMYVFLMQVVILISISVLCFYLFGKSETKGSKIFAATFGFLLMFVAILQVLVITEEYSLSPKLTSTFETVYVITKYAVGIGVIALFILVGLILYKSWRFKRGMDD